MEQRLSKSKIFKELVQSKPDQNLQAQISEISKRWLAMSRYEDSKTQEGLSESESEEEDAQEERVTKITFTMLEEKYLSKIYSESYCMGWTEYIWMW